MHCDTLKQDNDSTVRGDGGSRVGEVRAGTTSPMPEHKGFKLQQLSRDPLTPADGPGSVSVKVLNIYKLLWLKTLMVGHGGSSAASYLADPTSPIPSHCASIAMTSTLRVSYTKSRQLKQESGVLEF